MLLEQGIESGFARLRRERQIGLRVASPVLARGGNKLREGIGLVLLDFYIHIQSKAI